MKTQQRRHWFAIIAWFACIGWLACDNTIPKVEPTDEKRGEQTQREYVSIDRDGADSAEPKTIDTLIMDSTNGDAGTQEKPPERLVDATSIETQQDAGTPETTGPDIPLGAPIQAAARKWEWIDIPGAKCGYGGDTGFAINLNPGATRVFIYFQGGGACWKEKGGIGSCYEGVPTSFNLNGFTKKTFERDLVTRQNINSAIFDRKDFNNVFHDAHMVFFPYCTGDVFSGQKIVEFSKGRKMHFVGHNNIKLFLSRLVPTFNKAKQVVIAGSSAGGFGAALNWWLVQRYFGAKVRVDLIDDSGPPIEPKEGRWAEWYKIWNSGLPPGCSGCDKKISALLDYYKRTMLKQGRRMGFLTYDRDAVIRNFFGISNFLGTEFKKRIDALFDEMDTEPNAHYFALSGSSHTLMIITPRLLRSKDRVPLMRWLEWMVEDNPSWKSHRP